MKLNKFVVAVGNLTAEQEEKFINALKDEGIGWWHMISNVWLLSSYNNEITTKQILHKITAIPNIEYSKIFIMDITDSKHWNGFGQAEDFDWMKNNWDK